MTVSRCNMSRLKVRMYARSYFDGAQYERVLYVAFPSVRPELVEACPEHCRRGERRQPARSFKLGATVMFPSKETIYGTHRQRRPRPQA